MAKEIIREKESKTDIAYRVMLKKDKERNFYDLWNDVKKQLAKVMSEEELANIDEDISFFYTNLTLDGRFVNVGDNKWNLRERVTFDKVHIDMNDIYADDEDEDTSDDDDKENAYVSDEYDDSFDDPSGTDADITQYRSQKVDADDEEDI